jgi:paired amphipathic helix protein Sin3a
MDAEERLAFRLEEGMGGSSPSIYERVVKKVYGRDQGNEILQALYNNPTVAVPIVLARLKQKDEEWKRALREWNKVWREVVRFQQSYKFVF